MKYRFRFDGDTAGAVVAVFALLMQFAWTVLVFATCTYLVFWQGHSGWWFLLAFALCTGGGTSE